MGVPPAGCTRVTSWAVPSCRAPLTRDSHADGLLPASAACQPIYVPGHRPSCVDCEAHAHQVRPGLHTSQASTAGRPASLEARTRRHLVKQASELGTATCLVGQHAPSLPPARHANPLPEYPSQEVAEAHVPSPTRVHVAPLSRSQAERSFVTCTLASGACSGQSCAASQSSLRTTGDTCSVLGLEL